MRFLTYSILLFMFCISYKSYSKEQFYELDINYKTTNITGESIEAMLINNQLPGPVLEFTEGDVAIIKVNNHLRSDASIHWHGLLLPQDQDGVPYITYYPIKPGESFTYRFPITHTGTYWYHSHTLIDEQRGQYGSIIIHPKQKRNLKYDHDVVVQLSDWTNESPVQALRNLKKNGDWYSLKKNSVISLYGYLEHNAFSNWLSNRWMRMDGMDVSDVGYDAFLANGVAQLKLLANAKAGDVIRLRFINSAASSYFRLEQSNTPFTVINADGIDVQPITVDKILMGMAETYDVLVTVPESGGLEINANNIDGTGKASIRIGSGKFIAAPLPIKPNLYAKMNHGSHTMIHNKNNNKEHHHKHHNKHNKKQLSYKMLKTVTPIKYEGKVRTIKLDLTGDMESYNWNFNNTPLTDADVIKIKRGDVVRFELNNKTMMRHPLHLHGHFFKVISGNEEYDVLKHTVDIGPMEKVTIEFTANEEKDWFFHCHNLYHAKTGMARVIRYHDYPGNSDFIKAKKTSNEIMDDDWYSRLDLSLYNNFIAGKLRLSNFHYSIEIDSERADWQENQIHLSINRRVNRWTRVFIGSEYETDKGTEYQLGIRYHTPFSFETAVWLNDELEPNGRLGTELQLTKHIVTEFSIDTEDDWFFDIEYRFSPNISLNTGVRDNSDWGVGIKLIF